jgi:hypothetical protein
LGELCPRWSANVGEVVDIKDGAERAKRRILGERVDLMRNGHLYRTDDHAFRVDGQMRVGVREHARIHWRQPVWWADIGILRVEGGVAIYLPGERGEGRKDPARWMPERLTEAEVAELVPVTAIFVGGVQSLLANSEAGYAILPHGMEAPVIGLLEDGQRGYIRDSYGLETATTIDRETEVSENPGGTVSIRCERDGGDLLIDFHGAVLRLEMVGELVPGRKGRAVTFAADSPHARDYAPRVPDLVGAVNGSGAIADTRRERAGIAEQYIIGAETSIGVRNEAARRERAALPSLRDRAPARRPSPPTVQ